MHPVHKPWFVKQAWVQYCTHGFWLWVLYGRHAGLQRLWLWFLLLCIHCTQRMIVADGCCCTRSVRCTQPCVRGVSSMAVVRRFAARGCAEDSCSRLWRRAARETPGRHPGVHEKEYSRARRRRAAAAYPSTRIDARHPTLRDSQPAMYHSFVSEFFFAKFLGPEWLPGDDGTVHSAFCANVPNPNSSPMAQPEDTQTTF